jgi:hypothetical protein
MSKTKDYGFVGDAILASSLLGAALAASAANYSRLRAEQNEESYREWNWRSAAVYWEARALRAERLLAAAEAELDELD